MSTITNPRTRTVATAVEAELRSAQIELQEIRADLRDAAIEFEMARDRDEIASIRAELFELALLLPARAPVRRNLMKWLFRNTAPAATSAPLSASETGRARR